MAEIGSKFVTLAEVAKKKDPKIGGVAEVLVQNNPILNDIPYREMNEGTIHVEEIRSELPAVYYRKANQAIPASKTTTEERTFSHAHFESKVQIDKMVAERGGDLAYNRWNQAMGHLQANAIEHASLLIYGSPLNSHQKVPGLADVYSSLSGTEPVSNQIIDAKIGSPNANQQSSIYLIHWGEQSIFGVYPKGTQAGIKRTDFSPNGKLVKIIGKTATGEVGDYMGYEELFEVDHGLVVKDYRQGARIANIDSVALKADPKRATQDIIRAMINAQHRIANPDAGKGVWYVNRLVASFLYHQALESVTGGGGLTFENYDGKKILHFMGLPVRRTDGLLTTEAVLT